jgi:hypothetical protein
MQAKSLSILQEQLAKLSPGDPLVVLYDYLQEKIADVYLYFQRSQNVQEYLLAHKLGLVPIKTQTMAVNLNSLSTEQKACLATYKLLQQSETVWDIVAYKERKIIAVQLEPFESIDVGSKALSHVERVILRYGDNERIVLEEGKDYIFFYEDARIILLDCAHLRKDYLGGFKLEIEGLYSPVSQLHLDLPLERDYVRGESIIEFLLRFKNVVHFLRSIPDADKSNVLDKINHLSSSYLQKAFLETMLQQKAVLNDADQIWQKSTEKKRDYVVAKAKEYGFMLRHSDSSELTVEQHLQPEHQRYIPLNEQLQKKNQHTPTVEV